jgi:tRNA modification GTPase
VSVDTIFALSSGRPPAAVSIIRVSGPLAHKAGDRLAGSLPDARFAVVRRLRGRDGTAIDDALVLRFDGPASSTGENVVEFQCHGGRSVVDAMLRELEDMEGFRVARPGEFTRRAFENGRIDLTQAEGLADLIEAETESQRKTALAVAEGGLRREVEEWQYRVVQLSARAEAAIDYADQDGADRDLGLSSDCDALASEIAEWLERPRTEPLKDGVRVVIAGPPNSGKSSLINAIAGQERAIVTDLPGTTRDHIDVPIALEGIPVLLTDTAGLRETEEVVERLGVERAKSLMDAADVLVWLGDSTDLPGHSNALQVYPRADLPDRRDVPAGSLAVSSRTGEGLGALLARVGEMARSFLPVEGAISLNRRQATEIAEAHAGLAAAAAAPDLVIAAENLRAARSAFDRLTGRAGIEDVLDALFGRFCLGK